MHSRSMGCDLCGKEGPLTRVRVEGIVLAACSSCKEHGEVIAESPIQEPQRHRPREERKPEVIELVKEQCGREIKRAREQRGLTQKELAQKLRIKESQLHAYESGNHKPDLTTARRFERALGIRIIETFTDEGDSSTHSPESHGTFTLGDLIKKR